MVDNVWDSLASLYSDVGSAMMSRAEIGSNELYLYAEAGDGWVEASLFSIGVDKLEWIGSDNILFESILALWEAEEPAKRWTAMEFEVRGTAFKTQLWYEGELPPNDLGFERREELIRRRFGNLEIIYPPVPDT